MSFFAAFHSLISKTATFARFVMIMERALYADELHSLFLIVALQQGSTEVRPQLSADLEVNILAYATFVVILAVPVLCPCRHTERFMCRLQCSNDGEDATANTGIDLTPPTKGKTGAT